VAGGGSPMQGGGDGSCNCSDVSSLVAVAAAAPRTAAMSVQWWRWRGDYWQRMVYHDWLVISHPCHLVHLDG
jgi:hypothetical protein